MHSLLLPELEQKDLYNSINFSDKAFLVETSDAPNHSVAGTVLNVFLCPSDSYKKAELARTSYAVNFGYGYCEGRSYSACNNGPAALAAEGAVRPQDITDGLSNTVAASEWLFNPSPPNRRDQKRSVFWLKGAIPRSNETYAQAVKECAGFSINQGRIDPDGRGSSWLLGSSFTTMYSHAIIIGGNSCTNGQPFLGMPSASSAHGAGVNALFCDGHASFVRESMTIHAWRAIGTRNGGEVVADTSN